MTNSTNTTKVIASPTMDSRQLASGFASMLLGSLLIALIGFAPMPAVHNAAHDTRHSSAFPCH
ncbi:MAG: CbtB domain-containing protein [Spongiibacteraceae bacterium]